MYLTRFCALADMFLMPQPNMTKLPLQVLAVIEGKSEKIRFRINHVLGKYIGLNIKSSTHISHCVFSHFLSMAGLESGIHGPFREPPLPYFHFSPLGTSTRKCNPKWCIFNHYSWPKGHSINNKTPDEEGSLFTTHSPQQQMSCESQVEVPC